MLYDCYGLVNNRLERESGDSDFSDFGSGFWLGGLTSGHDARGTTLLFKAMNKSFRRNEPHQVHRV